MTNYIDLDACDPELVVVQHGGTTYGGTLEEFQTAMAELRRRAAAEDERWKVRTPIELRLGNSRLSDGWVLTMWVNDHGIIGHSMNNGRGGSPYSLSTLQMKDTMPSKAVPGWQEEAIAAAGSGLYSVLEVR